MHDLISSIPPLPIAIAIGITGLIFTQLFSLSKIRSLLPFLCALLIGAIAGISTIHVVLGRVKIERVHRLSPLLENALANIKPDREQIILVGQSLSYYGLDGELLEKLINGDTQQYQIIQLTVEGTYPIDQDFILETYLSRTPRLPIAIFFDFGFDAAYFPSIPSEQKFMELPIAASNWSRTAQQLAIDWRLNAPLIQEAWPKNLIAVATASQTLFLEAVSSLSHFLCQTTNCGILFHVAHPLPGTGYTSGFKERVGHAPNFRLLDAPETTALQCTGQHPFLNASLGFRRWQKAKYQSSGVSLIAFYFPPALNPYSRCFAIVFCKAMTDVPCVNGENEQLLNEIKRPELWYDVFHLNASGALLYTASFADDVKRIMNDAKSQTRK